MSADAAPGEFETARQIHYEVSASKDVVTLTIEADGEELSVSTNPQSALLLASDILSAADRSTDAGIEGGEEFVFGR